MTLVRLQKWLASAGVCSRRKGEVLIREGRVAVNGQVVTELGTKIDPQTDRVAVDGAPVAALTGDGSSETARRCREAGCALVLSKSSKLGDIGEVLERIEQDWQEQTKPRRHEPELAKKYRDYLAETLQELRLAQMRRDLDSARRIGHRLRGEQHQHAVDIRAKVHLSGKHNRRVLDARGFLVTTLEQGLDALAGGPGRAEDLAIKLGHRPAPGWVVSIGYRMVEGGADVEEVYSFAWLHYLVRSAASHFEWVAPLNSPSVLD